ncbi:MAG TPA: ATP-grasp domain-containing protein, partial [Dehalococcoidia bacterium]|nr:ATP-grasp domain-containing protein [Dehalococcoidia bacterium]
MKLFEFEAKQIMRQCGLATPKGGVAATPAEAAAIARELGKPVVLKAQILVAGRGKAGGIKFADDAEAAGR